MHFIDVDQLTKSYQSGHEQVHVLDRVTLTIEQGEFVAIMGPSGSGKSTLLTALGGLNRPSEGRVSVHGIDLYTLDRERRADFRREYIGFIFQSFQLISYLTVVENVLLPLAVTSYPNARQRSMAMAILEKVEMASRAHRLPDELSGGEQERVAVARALVNQPPIILADEPTGNLVPFLKSNLVFLRPHPVPLLKGEGTKSLPLLGEG